MKLFSKSAEAANHWILEGMVLLLFWTMVGCQEISLGHTTNGVAEGLLVPNSTSADFGTVKLGNSKVLSEIVTNSGSSSVTISQAGISGVGFTVTGIAMPMALGPGQSANVSVTFSPQSAGIASGSIIISSNSSNPTLTIALSGTGAIVTTQLSATPATLSAGSVVVGTTGTVSGLLSASGADVTITAVDTSNSRFTITGLSLPIVIPAGQSTQFSITFSPQIAGPDSATVTFTSDAQPASTTELTTGTGTAAPTHTVSLSWTGSTSPDITGYNIYRAAYGGSCGAFSKLNGSILDTGTAYTDSSVADGTNYCYATTAVNSSNEESGYSNVVSDVQIPVP